MSILENYRKIRTEIPDHVRIVIAGKTKTKTEILEVMAAGATDLGENYVQETEEMYKSLGEKAKCFKWHMIGNMQKNKINKVLKIFDMVQTVDSIKMARDINIRAQNIDKIIPVLIEINIGSEISKSGVAPEYSIIESLTKEISELKNIRLEGFMTMGPRTGDPERIRPFFRKTKEIFDKIKEQNIPNTDLQILSMGMSNSYKIAIEEGSNMIRPGTIIFGKR
jgi:PLP dependent protein